MLATQTKQMFVFVYFYLSILSYIYTKNVSQKKEGAWKWQQRDKIIQFKLLAVSIGHDTKAYIVLCAYVGSFCESHGNFQIAGPNTELQGRLKAA
jgi:hypothetical protein